MLNNPVIKGLFVFLAILFVIAPFAGLVPLMLLLLFAGVFYAIASIFNVPTHDEESEPHSNP
ncbi:hypothetical protein H6G89_18095 [Oscillatoria sp. FACHB-1407]|uniref:hypothetical protein n=1 Tax=Oscillatoria sp. FACHB-1407 TaxID=2692847 RepID=UPI001688E8AB|nr:hypothetical protein [Oscillatoria sp. FACHB-1407]MBD2462954.1 hypothetical protein [Oscillatoria sp. FACHB-1407]